MRLDKFLKVSRVIKRRTLANEACDGGRVSIGGKACKASTMVKFGDIIEIRFGEKLLRYEVLDVRATATKAQAGEMVRALGAYGSVDDEV